MIHVPPIPIAIILTVLIVSVSLRNWQIDAGKHSIRKAINLLFSVAYTLHTFQVFEYVLLMLTRLSFVETFFAPAAYPLPEALTVFIRHAADKCVAIPLLAHAGATTT